MTPPIDPEFVARVASIVVARLRKMEAAQIQTPKAETIVCPSKLIVASMLLDHPSGQSLTVRSDAVITPLAKDTAKDRHIELIREAAGKAR